MICVTNFSEKTVHVLIFAACGGHTAGLMLSMSIAGDRACAHGCFGEFQRSIDYTSQISMMLAGRTWFRICSGSESIVLFFCF